jgi:hypothetical protein
MQPYSCPTGSVNDPTSSNSNDLSDDECCEVRGRVAEGLNYHQLCVDVLQ